MKLKISLLPLNYLIAIIFLTNCNSKGSEFTADQLYFGGIIYTANTQQPTVEAVAILGDTILFAGTYGKAQAYTDENTIIHDLKGKTMLPGFIESHGHMMGLGYNELNLDLMDVKSYDELIDRVKEAVTKSKPGDWIIGRGWHQSKWDPQPENMVKGFPVHDQLSEISPDNPVWLRHASGHASLGNKKAMEIAGIFPLSIESMENEVEGGEIIRDDTGNPTGIFNERAQGVVGKFVPENSEESDAKALELAIAACQRNGITSFHDAGVGQSTIDLYKKFANEGKLGTRMYVMISGPDRELTNKWLERGPEIDTSNHLVTIRSIKLNCDGALGSRGAWLLDDYSDRPGHAGMATLPMEYVEEVSIKALNKGFQVCSHAIGDRANREVLDRYENAFSKVPNHTTNHRFRIEHAQHIDPADLPRFSEMGVIAAMQAIHMSSDRPWAIDRLGEKRIVEGAYMWQSLLKSGAKVINGSDVPVEPIYPFASFYASITRKTLKGTPEGGYEPEEKMTREQALISYTLDAAYGAFEEDIKGSIEKGKLADLIIIDRDIMTIPENEILETKVVHTILGGEVIDN
ncbi:MAG: amidohydrolase [Cyclobacteriaceae bacterium]|nr:amidohydrolase [Cyclobacteriaceae bacterium]